MGGRWAEERKLLRRSVMEGRVPVQGRGEVQIEAWRLFLQATRVCEDRVREKYLKKKKKQKQKHVSIFCVRSSSKMEKRKGKKRR